MSPDDPRHGSYAGYQAHRREGSEKCLACRIAERRHRKAYQMRRGPSPHVLLGEDAYTIVRDTPPAALARATGISGSLLRKMRREGPSIRVRRETRAKILAAGRRPTLIGSMRRLQALAAIGWSSIALAGVTGINVDNLNHIRRGARHHYCRAGIAERIAEAYEELSSQPPEPSRATAYVKANAARLGWAPPAAWDDIDDPNEQPKGIAAKKRTTWRTEDLAAEYEFLLSAGTSVEQAARQLGVTVSAVEQAQRRLAKESAA